MPTEPQLNERFGEADALTEILDWIRNRPEWQRLALEKISFQQPIGEQDIARFAELAKRGDVGDATVSAPSIDDDSASGAVVKLRSISGVIGVNALAEEQRLSFEKSGVTLVYGDNGSGKSGYARILKKVCRARSPENEQILGNIYQTAVGPQRAVVDYSVGGQNQSETWEPGKETTVALSAVSVFDSATANFHVEATNNVAYVPFPMKILEQLANVCKQVKANLDAERKNIESQTPESLKSLRCRPFTKTGKLLGALSASTEITEVEELAGLSEEEQARLVQLKSDLNQDPVVAARQLRTLKTRIEELSRRADEMAGASEQDRVTRLQELRREYMRAKEAAAAAATTLFTDDPLPDIGSDVWRVLWDAAKSYSERQAYTGEEFPFTGNESHCVLCQQPLTEDGKDRMGRFAAFVKDTTKQKEDQTRKAYRDAALALQASEMSVSEIREYVELIRSETKSNDLKQRLRKHLLTAKLRVRKIKREIGSDADLIVPSVSDNPSEEIKVCCDELATRAQGLEAAKGSDERKKLVQELEELEDREWLGGIKADVFAEISRKSDVVMINNANKSTSTNAITTKSSQLAKRLVTDALRGQFSREIDRLGVAGLAIELRREQSSFGSSQFKVALIDKPDVPVGDVLSEGEHRCVALAGFMAELATTDSESCIVFDDPVSSLDHMHREAVANRLAIEGLQRQVVVFTHDIAFLFLVNEACKEHDTHIGFRSINRGSELAGFCKNEAPANARPVTEVIKAMQAQIANQKIQYEQGDKDAWYRTVRSLQEQLRTTWERAVEEAVSPVLKRLSDKVDTSGLSKLTAVTIDDCEAMRKAYGRCSKLLHSQPDILNPPLPKPDDIESEITALGNWVEDLKDRQSKIDTA